MIFYDYLFLYEFFLKVTSPGEPLTRARLKSVLEACDECLVLGKDSGNEIASNVSQSRPSTRYAATTSALMHVPLIKFLSLSKYIRQELQELSQLGMAPEGDVDTGPVNFAPRPSFKDEWFDPSTSLIPSCESLSFSEEAEAFFTAA